MNFPLTTAEATSHRFLLHSSVITFICQIFLTWEGFFSSFTLVFSMKNLKSSGGLGLHCSLL